MKRGFVLRSDDKDWLDEVAYCRGRYKWLLLLPQTR